MSCDTESRNNQKGLRNGNKANASYYGTTKRRALSVPRIQRGLCFNLRVASAFMSLCLGTWSLLNGVQLMHRNVLLNKRTQAFSALDTYESLMEWSVVGSSLLVVMGVVMEHALILHTWLVGFGCLAILIVLELICIGLAFMTETFWVGFQHFFKGVLFVLLYGYWWIVVYNFRESILSLPPVYERQQSHKKMKVDEKM